MALPSFDTGWLGDKRLKPRIYVLEVRARDQPDGSPIASLLIERQEVIHRDERDGSIYEASIRISYERVEPKYGYRVLGKGYFSGGYSRGFSGDPSVSLTSETTSRGTVFLDPQDLQGHRVGTYLMNEIVTWVRQWPEATVRSVELLEGQAHSENKARRNRFYEQFGLVFDYRDADHREGLSLPMYASELKPVETWKANIRERDVREFIGEVIYEHDRMRLELIQRERAVGSLLSDMKLAEARPIRWALQRLWWRYSQTVFVSLLLSGLAALVWFKYKV